MPPPLKTREILIRLKRSAYNPHPHWDEVDCSGEPLRRIWIGPTDEYSSALGCIPLNPAAMAVSLTFMVIAVVNLHLTAHNGQFRPDDVGDISMAGIKFLIGVCGVLGCLCRWATGLTILAVGYNIMLCTVTVGFITRWIEWVAAILYYGWQPEPRDQWFMCVHFLCYLSVMLSPIYVCGIIYSLRMVFCVGGNGWESLNYLELRWRLKTQSRGADITEITLGRFQAAHVPPSQKLQALLRRSSSVPMLNDTLVPTKMMESHKFDDSRQSQCITEAPEDESFWGNP